MGVNQAIYTSSASGINKGGGMGIHTYNYSCSEEELSDFELGFCQYHFSGDEKDIPNLPTKLIYGKTEAGRYMQSCVTYIGKDYDKKRGRMGNLLSHMYSFEREDMKDYPVLLYGSPDYKTSIMNKEVDGSEPVDYLPEVESVRPGNLITVEVIQDFLRDDRIQMFCHLLGAVLQRDDIHKVIIYDSHENIIKWLAALEFALPLKCAMEITFSSYERDPMMSEFDIRGAVVGMSEGNCEDYEVGNQFYVFDGIHNRYPEFDVSAAYFKYGIEMGLDFAYEMLVDFFEFINRYKKYEKADMDILSGFKLYQMIQGGMEKFEKKEFEEGLSFEKKYGDVDSYQQMLKEVFEKIDKNSISDEELLENVGVLLNEYLKKELTSTQLDFGLSQLRIFFDIEQNSLRRQSILKTLAEYQYEFTVLISKSFIKEEDYLQLAVFESYLYMQKKEIDYVEEVKRLFEEYWSSAPLEKYHYFDSVIYEAVERFKKYEDTKEKYEDLVDLFLLIQNMGKKHIYGEGCENLINWIESHTEIIEKKQFMKKRKTDKVFENKLKKLAFEVFNYKQKNKVKIPVTKIQMLHIEKSIVEEDENYNSLTESHILRNYNSYPVIVEGVNDDDFRVYIEKVAEILTSKERSYKEYRLIFAIWSLNSRQKVIIIKAFMNCELDYFRKNKDIEGLISLLNAIESFDDMKYDDALNKCIIEIKPSLRDKISDSLKTAGVDETYSFWKEFQYSKSRRKKGFFGF